MRNQGLEDRLGKSLKRTDLPKIRDWQVQKNAVVDELLAMCALPCDFLVMFHLDYTKDDNTGEVLAAPMITGNLKARVPAFFDERYITTVSSGENPTFALQTKSSGMYRASTRRGAEGLFKLKEPSDIKALLRKAGWDDSDKEIT